MNVDFILKLKLKFKVSLKVEPLNAIYNIKLNLTCKLNLDFMLKFKLILK